MRFMPISHEEELGAIRGDLLRFARLQLRDAALAEDAVQDACVAALVGAEQFASRSAFKTWVFAILRNKIVDAIRIRARERPLLEGRQEEYSELEGACFEDDGHWRESASPARWADPAGSLEQNRFWTVFEACLDGLPEKTGRVFMMREFLGFETGEICAELGLSSANCWVILHRARLGLRACLEQRWFVGNQEGLSC
jgi:RNA polymerase sigma-70 factor (ECF subfamily)